MVQGITALGVFAFQHIASGILLTTKSYLIRTAILSVFLFFLLPLGKVVLIKLGLMSMSPVLLSRAYHHNDSEDPYEQPSLHTLHGILEVLLWEMYAMVENFYQPDEIDDYLYL